MGSSKYDLMIVTSNNRRGAVLLKLSKDIDRNDCIILSLPFT